MILSLLDLPSLARTSQTCHRLRHLSIPPLYRTVTITSRSQLHHFFVPTPIPNLAPSLALERATARRADLDSIRHLVLDLYPTGDTLFGPATPSLPKLLSLRSKPLELDSLRISYFGTMSPFLSLVKCINPRKLHMFWDVPYQPDQEWGLLLSLGTKSFSRVETLTFSPFLPSLVWTLPTLAALGGRSTKSTPFKNVKQAVLFISPSRAARVGLLEGAVAELVQRFLAFTPALRGLRIVVANEEMKEIVEGYLEEAVGGSGKVESLVVEIGEGVEVEKESARVVWPGDEKSQECFYVDS